MNVAWRKNKVSTLHIGCIICRDTVISDIGKPIITRYGSFFFGNLCVLISKGSPDSNMELHHCSMQEVLSYKTTQMNSLVQGHA